MLIQKRGLNKRTRYLLLALLLIIIGGGYFVYKQFYATPSTTDTSETPTPILAPVKVESFDDDIFDNPQLYELERGSEITYTDQQTGTLIDDTHPLAPLHVSVVNPAIGESLTLSWETPEYVNFSETRIYRSTAVGTIGDLLETLPTKTAKQLMTYQDTTAKNNVRYYYLVRMANGDYESANTTQVTSVATDSLPPTAPEKVTVSASDDALEISWYLPQADDVSTVRVYRSTVRGTLGSLLEEIDMTEATPTDDDVYTLRDTTADANTTYYYTVTSVDANGNESSTDLLTVPARSNPFAPVSF